MRVKYSTDFTDAHYYSLSNPTESIGSCLKCEAVLTTLCADSMPLSRKRQDKLSLGLILFFAYESMEFVICVD